MCIMQCPDLFRATLSLSFAALVGCKLKLFIRVLTFLLIVSNSLFAEFMETKKLVNTGIVFLIFLAFCFVLRIFITRPANISKTFFCKFDVQFCLISLKCRFLNIIVLYLPAPKVNPISLLILLLYCCVRK